MRSWSFVAGAVLALAATGATHEIDVPELASRSGTIFRGTVLAVVAEAPRAPGEVAVTRLTCRVVDGIRGTTTGETLTIRQWNVAADEYRVGEELVMFLYAPSEDLGLTSPVGGRAGHRRVEEISADALNRLRTAARSVNNSPPASSSPQRPARPARGGSQ